MNLPLFLARRIHFGTNRRHLPPAIRIAILGVALGVAVMIVATAVVVGFKHQVRQKVIGFGAHIQITNFSDNTSYETLPIAYSDSIRNALTTHYPQVLAIEPTATKPGILKTKDDFLGVAIKGVQYDYDWRFFEESLLEGSLPQLSDTVVSNQVLVSRTIADKMGLAVGDKIATYFVQEDVRVRRFEIVGIYQTNFSDYDNIFIIGDIRHIQRLNGWDTDQFSAIELRLDSYDELDAVTSQLYYELIEKTDRYGNTYYVRSVKELNPQLFEWLELLDLNVWIILLLMSVVAGFTMISGLLIIILERTQMIGILKALGANNTTVRRTFLYVALFLVVKGMLWGNIIGILLCLIQKYFGVISLDPQVYFIAAVPIEFSWTLFLLLNIGALFVTLLMLIAPSYIVAKIAPAQAIKFE